MKAMLKLALIATLTWGASACTVVTDPSGGTSATTGGSSSAVFMNRQEQIAAFTNTHLERLKQDMAAGQGEYLTSLATLLEIEASRQPEFFAFTQRQFPVLFPNERTTAAEMLVALDRALLADPRFGQRLALN
jgi:hypothetical protein